MLRRCRNSLTRLPEEISQLTGLTYLDASQNALTTLPAALITLASLRGIELSKNQLAQLPDGGQHFTSVKLQNTAQ